MAAWAISIVGIVLLTVICDMMLPDGQTSKYIKTITSIIAIFVMVSPAIALLKGDIIVDDILSKEYEINVGYIEHVNETISQAYEDSIVKSLSANGYKNAVVTISMQGNYGNYKIKKVDIDIQNLVITQQNYNIDIVVTDIISIVANIVNVDSDKVNVYGTIQ